MNKRMKILTLMIVIVLTAGCINNSNKVQSINQTVEDYMQPVITQNEYSQIITELKNENKMLEDRVSTLETTITKYGLSTTNKLLIPEHFPFVIEGKTAEWQPSTTWTFYEVGEVHIQNAWSKDIASYKIDRPNNTIQIKSSIYLYYGLRLKEGYVETIYENGALAGVYVSSIKPPKYNTVTEQYELH